jgi:hypothetical protein
MRSEKEPKSLIVEGLLPKELDALGWSPTDLSFLDLSTGSTERFLVERSDNVGVVKFAIKGHLEKDNREDE